MNASVELKKYGYTVNGNTSYDVLVNGEFVGQVWKIGKAWLNSQVATISKTRKEALAYLLKYA